MVCSCRRRSAADLKSSSLGDAGSSIGSPVYFGHAVSNGRAAPADDAIGREWDGIHVSQRAAFALALPQRTRAGCHPRLVDLVGFGDFDVGCDLSASPHPLAGRCIGRVYGRPIHPGGAGDPDRLPPHRALGADRLACAIRSGETGQFIALGSGPSPRVDPQLPRILARFAAYPDRAGATGRSETSDDRHPGDGSGRGSGDRQR